MSGRIPQPFIDELIERADIAEVLGSRLQLRRAGREYKALCPFHDEKTPSFTVSPDKGFYHCFGCGAHGTALGFLMEHDHLSFPEAVEELAGMLGLEVPREAGAPRDRRIDKLYEVMRRVEQFYAGELARHPAAAEYLRERGIDEETARAYRLGYAPAGWDTLLGRFGGSDDARALLASAGLTIRKDTGREYDRFRERLMFPIRDGRGRTVGFGGRVLGDGEPKYLNSPETALFHKGRELYGLYETRKRLRDIRRLVLVEGYMDVVALARHGIHYAVATLGTATTADQLNRLFRITDEVHFCFDGDRAGRQAAWRAMENALPLVREGRRLSFVFLPEGHDPDSLVRAEGADAFEAALDEGVPLSSFLIGELAERTELDSVDGRARLAELARPLIGRVPPGVYRTLLIEELAAAVGLGPEKLERMLAGDGDARSRGQRRARRAAALQIGGLSAIAKAIRVLLHYPSAGRGIDLERLAGLERRGAKILAQMLEMVQHQPDISAAGLLERWRGHEHWDYLSRLAGSPLLEDSGADPEASLMGLIDQLERQSRKDRVDHLREKLNDQGLSDEELSELQTLVTTPERSMDRPPGKPYN